MKASACSSFRCASTAPSRPSALVCKVIRDARSEVNNAMEKEPNTWRIQLFTDEACPDSSFGMASIHADRTNPENRQK